MPSIIEVAIAVPVNNLFDYKCQEKVAIGSRVEVPFGNGDKKVTAVVISHKKTSDFDELKSISKIIDKKPIFSKEMLDFLFFSAKYYHHAIGEVILSSMPKNLRLGKAAEIKNNKDEKPEIKESKFKTNKEQKEAIKAILSGKNQHKNYLLHGVTGSGKTEIYLSITEQILAEGGQVLVLVPEIGLTPQMISRFKDRINAKVVTVHSQLNETQKTNAYLMAKENEAKVILGTRSAIFAQMPNLKMIIIDEEHDSSFKQQSSFRYSAKHLSFIRAKLLNIPLILGSATPSLETLKNVLDKKIERLVLSERPAGSIMPEVNLIDINNEKDNALSKNMIAKIKNHLADNNQVMLFINRRGYAPIFYCNDCQWQAECKHCDVKLIYHRDINRLMCHHCGYKQIPNPVCPSCKKTNIKVLGYGTARLEESLASYFPNTSIIRIDHDTTRKKASFNQHLEKINSGEPCIIVGTQMLAKGHDFSKLSFVGVLDIDLSLLSSDFRATENLAQLLIQVSGRSGRNKKQGEVSIQTRYPKHNIFKYIKKAYYTRYASILLEERRKYLLPPFSYQAIICANSKKKEKAEKFLQEISKILHRIAIEKVKIWGPFPATIEKQSDYYYFNLHLQSTDRKNLHIMIKTMYKNIGNIKIENGLRWFLDVDPID